MWKEMGKIWKVDRVGGGKGKSKKSDWEKQRWKVMKQELLKLGVLCIFTCCAYGKKEDTKNGDETIN